MSGRIAFLLVAMVAGLAAPAVAQTGAPATSQAKPASVLDVAGHAGERILKSITFGVAWGDLPEAAFNADGELQPLLDESLWKVTAKVELKSLFLSPADLKESYGSLKALEATVGRENLRDQIANVDAAALPAYFLRARPLDRLGRLVAGFSLGASLLERPESDFGSGGRGDAGEATKWSFDLVFDPASLFVTAADHAAAYTALASYLKVFPERVKGLAKQHCTPGEDDRSCLEKLAGTAATSGQRARRVLAAVLPTVKVESVDEFDYAVLGGVPVLLPPEGRDRALQNFELSWKLASVLPASKARRDALAALKARAELNAVIEALAVPGLEVTTQALTVQHGVNIAAPLQTNAVGGVWTADRENWPVRSLYLTANGVLLGQPRCPGGATACQTTLGFKVTDAAGREIRRSISLTIRP